MYKFLHTEWLNNIWLNYFVVAGIILFIVLVKKYLAQSIALLIFKLINRVWKDIDKKTFIRLVARPLGSFLAVLVTVVALHKLNFPKDLNREIYNITTKELFNALGSLVIILFFVRLLLRTIDFIAIILNIRANQTPDPTDNQLIVFFKDFFKVILVVVGLLMILKFVFGSNIGNLLTGLSIVGAAIALALRESLENLIASFIIFFDKPFSLGDVVKVHNFTGTVEKIGLRSTRIRTDQKTYITVPNKQMVDSILDNLSLRTQRKGELRLEVGLSTTATSLEQFTNGIRLILDQKEIESSTVLLNDINSSSYQILIEYFTGPITQKDFNFTKEQVNFNILKLMEELHIEISGTSTEIRISGRLAQTNTD
jgi:MscS family membrane protein